MAAQSKSKIERTQTTSTTTLPSKEELRTIALSALVDVARDKVAPSAARAAAARTMLESIGDIGRLQEVARQSEKPFAEMSRRELDEEIERLSDHS